MHHFGRVLDLPNGPKERPSRGLLLLHRKWTDLDEIWNVASQMLGAATADFGRDPRSRNILIGSWNFVFCFGQVNNARFHQFPVGQFSRILHTTTSIGVVL